MIFIFSLDFNKQTGILKHLCGEKERDIAIYKTHGMSRAFNIIKGKSHGLVVVTYNYSVRLWGRGINDHNYDYAQLCFTQGTCRITANGGLHGDLDGTKKVKKSDVRAWAGAL